MKMITLRDYQHVAEDFLLSRPAAILADQAGLGKTPPTITAGLTLAGPKLVVVPKYLTNTWIDALRKQDIPESDIHVVEGSPTAKARVIEEGSTGGWTIISYNMLGQTHPAAKGNKVEGTTENRYGKLLRTKYGAVVFDEAHRMRGRQNMWTKQAHKLRTDYKWLLTGSPIYRDAGDLFALLQVCDPKTFSSFGSFVDEHCNVKEDQYKYYGVIVGLKDSEAFQEVTRPYMLRRLMSDVSLSLPELLDPISVRPDLYVHTQNEYDVVEAYIKQLKRGGEMEHMQAQGLLTRLRQLTGADRNKLQAVSDLVSDINERVVVMCWFRESARLVARKIGTDLIVTGAVSNDDRQIMLDRLSLDPHGVLVATMESLKEGLNLQHTSNVVFYEQDWLSESNDQAVGRFHRFGQTKQVQPYFVRAHGTIDDAIFNVSNRRSQQIIIDLVDYLVE